MMNAVMPGVATDHLDTEPSSRFVRDRLFFLGVSVGKVKYLEASAVQRFMKPRGKRIMTVGSSAFAAQLPDNGRTGYSPFQIHISVDHKVRAQSPLTSHWQIIIGRQFSSYGMKS